MATIDKTNQDAIDNYNTQVDQFKTDIEAYNKNVGDYNTSQNFNFNTAVSSFMILATEMEKAENVSVEDYKKFLQILSPFIPHTRKY